MPGYSIVDTAPSLAEATVAWDAAFSRAFAESTEEMQSIESLIMSSNSTTKKKRWVLPGMLPKMREWLGERVYHVLTRYVAELENRKFELSVEVDVDDVDDDELGGYTQIFSEFGRQARLWPRDLIVEKLLAGDTQKGFDDQFFFDTDHPIDLNNGGAGVYSNLLSGGGSVFGEAGVEAAFTALSRIPGPDGRPMGIRGTTVIVPPQLEIPAARLFSAPQNAAGGTNVFAGKANVIVIPELAAFPTQWYLTSSRGALKPFIFQERLAPRVTALDRPDDPDVFKRNMALYGVKARGAAGFGLPWLIVKNTGA